MSNLCALDLETAPIVSTSNPYALEPFRVRQGKAHITDLSISFGDHNPAHLINPSKSEIRDILQTLHGTIIFMHNAVFDVGWLYAYVGIEPLRDLDFRCTMLLAKWILNSQRLEYGNFSLSLANLVKFYLPEDPLTDEFVKLKEDPAAEVAGEDAAYWSERADWDTLMTYKLARVLLDKLPVEQRRGFAISQKCLPYTARSWVDGIPFNWDKINATLPKIEAGKKQLASKVGVAPSVIQSSTQLSDLLFQDWDLKPISMGKTRGSTKAGDLKMLALQSAGTELGEKMKYILEFKKLQTLLTKYINGFSRTREYIGEDVCHGAPRIFGTYTGRYTYSSMSKRKQIWQTSIAMHQLPRLGPAKSWLEAPEGYDVVEYDATGQEIAFMAIASLDPNLCSVLNQGMNVHSWMATNLTGEGYNEFLDRLHSDGDVGADAYETRQAAKLLNLSCQYRIGANSLKSKFFENYDKLITVPEGKRYLNIYKAAYPGVVQYWKDICILSEARGYTETIAKRRFYLTDWATHRWGTESSAINTPIQGSGGDQKDLVIWLVSQEFPELKFALDMHDGLFWFIPQENQDELKKDILSFILKIDYEHWWQREIPVPLEFEGMIGPNFKEKVEYKV